MEVWCHLLSRFLGKKMVYAAPVSKGLLGTVFLTSCALNVPLFSHVKHYMTYSVSAIFQQYEIWRLLTARITFLDTKHLICGSLLIYYFRIFERRYGSHKFASYLLAVFTVATFLEMATVCALSRADILHISHLPSGPFGLILPLFVNYFLDIPRVAHSYFLGVPFDRQDLHLHSRAADKLRQELLVSSKEALITGLCSLAAGLVCRYNVLNIRRAISVPQALAKLCGLTLGRLLKSAPPTQTSPLGATLEIQRQQQLDMLEQHLMFSQQTRQQMGQGYTERLLPPSDPQAMWGAMPFFARRRVATPPNDTTGPVPEEQVRTLVEMGFDRQSVVRALRHSNNDVHAATSILLAEG
ncbi:UBAC2 [Cordylochernes scorpioides]|uniref:UBAC2 n=1 Tax=Cordylochernes scorpioides TaxID=51811 RepID=A0ABY6KPE1_9ARAC|nr:UBAC2 [Cordylochernes scorpioides]